jgi:hypothetical protein
MAGGPRFTCPPEPGASFFQAVRKVTSPSKREIDANNIFRLSDSPLTEYEKEQKAVRKNLERLRAERLAREAANAGHSPKQKERYHYAAAAKNRRRDLASLSASTQTGS